MDKLALILSYLLTCTSPVAVRAAALEYCVAIEIIDPCHVERYLASHDQFGRDIAILLDRYQTLASAPRLADLAMFPDRDGVAAALNFNRLYRQHMVLRQAVERVRFWEHREAIQETDWLFNAWDKLRDAGCEHYHIGTRRQALEDLRRLIGAAAYYRGQMPPAVPYWRFEVVE